MYSNFLTKFLTEALHFPGVGCFSRNEIVVINITPPHIILTPTIEVYPPTNVRKTLSPQKFWQIFKLSFVPRVFLGMLLYIATVSLSGTERVWRPVSRLLRI